MKLDYHGIPSAVFSQPPVATVGLSEAQAREQHAEVDIYRSRFRPMKHTLSGRDEQTMMKLVVDRPTNRVLGAHMVGADAPEIIQGWPSPSSAARPRLSSTPRSASTPRRQKSS